MDINRIADQTLNEIAQEVKPYVDQLRDMKEALITIQGIFYKKSFTPAKYGGFETDTSFVVWLTDEELRQQFQCKKIWIELASENKNLLDKIYDLRDMLNHEWAIFVINQDGSYHFYRPLIWSKMQGIKNIVKQL